MSSPTTQSLSAGRKPAPPAPTIFSAAASACSSRSSGHRAGSDAVFLAAAVPARAGDRVLDIGAGVGVAGLCLLARVPGVDVTAVEIDAKLCGACRAECRAEWFRATSSASSTADVTAPGKSLRAAGLHARRLRSAHRQPALPCRRQSKSSAGCRRAPPRMSCATGGLAAWMRFFAAMAAPKGLLTLIHRPDCLGELLAPARRAVRRRRRLSALSRGAAKPATRIIVQAEEGKPGRAQPSARASSCMRQIGSYTEAAEAVLRGGEALDLGRSKNKGRRLGGKGGSPRVRPSVRSGLGARQARKGAPDLAPKI